MHRRLRPAFTLIELLVVITIIVVLLALLTPALDKAIYQAELAVCGANLRSIATGAVSYASGSNRSYPYRPGVRDDMVWPTAQIYNGSLVIQSVYNGLWSQVNPDVYDDRPILRTFLGLNSALNDPLTGKLGYETLDKGTTAYSTVNLWFGYGFQGFRAMKKIGDRLTWAEKDPITGNDVRWRFDVLAADRDSMPANTGNNSQCTHPDDVGRSRQVRVENGQYSWGPNFTVSFWESGQSTRGLVDLNFAHADGSVRRLHKVAWNDDNEKVARVPEANLSPPNAYRVTMPPQK
jgi:prepilin-type N-terminal cleavage/methylation domain-containing protein